MANSYKLANQKILQTTTSLEEDIFYLKLRTFKAPCILTTGLDKLHLSKIIKYSGEKEKHAKFIIHSLFTLLNIPITWILSIDIPPGSNQTNCIPSEIMITLITDNVKLYVFKTLTNYIKDTNQKLVFFKLLTH